MKQLQESVSIRESWSVQIYSGDRRLICSLYPSHIWMFSLGLAVGVIFASVSFTQASSSAIEPSSTAAPMEAPLSLD